MHRNLIYKIASIQTDLELLREASYQFNITPGDFEDPTQSDRVQKMFKYLVENGWGGGRFPTLQSVYVELQRKDPNDTLIVMLRDLFKSDFSDMNFESAGRYPADLLKYLVFRSSSGFWQPENHFSFEFITKFIKECKQKGWNRSKPSRLEVFMTHIIGLALSTGHEDYETLISSTRNKANLFLSFCGLAELDFSDFPSDASKLYLPDYSRLQVSVTELQDYLMEAETHWVEIGGKIHIFDTILDTEEPELARVTFPTGLSFHFLLDSINDLPYLREDSEYITYYWTRIFPDVLRGRYTHDRLPHPRELFGDLEDVPELHSDTFVEDLEGIWENLILEVRFKGNVKMVCSQNGAATYRY